MIVSVSGYGQTGSSAVVDLLKEYDEIDCPHENELDILYVPGGILNLDYSLNNITARFFQSDYALTTFKKIIKNSKNKHNTYNVFTNGKFYNLANDYFNKIYDCEWDGTASYDHYFYSKINIFFRYAIVRRLEKIFGTKPFEKLNISYNRKMYFSIHPDNFLNETKTFISSIIKSANFNDNKIKLINQFIPGNFANECFKYINEDCKAIIVRRDPRDVFISCKYIRKTSSGYAPTNVNDFITYYRKMIENKETNNNILYVNFEDLIYKYNETVKSIEDFLNISNHKNTNMYFKPEISVANTKLFNRYNCHDEVSIIEKELKNYLYEFPTTNVDYSIKPFFKHDKL